MSKGAKFLILVPASSARGGITNYYQSLIGELSKDYEYFERGSRTWPLRNSMIKELLRAWNDFKNFRSRLSVGDIGLIQTTTSLSLSTTIRDGLFVRYAIKKGIKAIVFFRGWDASAVKKVGRYRCLFRYFFFKADKLITLSEKANEILFKWGYKREIIVETTLVDRNLLNNVNESSIIQKYELLANPNSCFRLLYLSRIEKRKGIYDLLEAYEILNHPDKTKFVYTLNICGDGSEVENIKALVKARKLKNINIQGYVEGKLKEEAFREADLFILPSHGEGMPNAVLEAMGFGLPVLTTPVGGIMDFFVPGINGYYINIKDPNDIAKKINSASMDLNLLMKISLNNFKLAHEKFRSDKVAARIDSIFKKLLEN